MEHPKAKGDKSTLAVIVALREIGYDVLVATITLATGDDGALLRLTSD